MTISSIKHQSVDVSNSNKKRQVPNGVKNVSGQLLTLSGATALGAMGGLAVDKLMHNGFYDPESFIGKIVAKKVKNCCKYPRQTFLDWEQSGCSNEAVRYKKTFFEKFGYDVDWSGKAIYGTPFTKLAPIIMLAVTAASLLLYNGIRLLKSSKSAQETIQKK